MSKIVKFVKQIVKFSMFMERNIGHMFPVFQNQISQWQGVTYYLFFSSVYNIHILWKHLNIWKVIRDPPWDTILTRIWTRLFKNPQKTPFWLRRLKSRRLHLSDWSSPDNPSFTNFFLHPFFTQPSTKSIGWPTLCQSPMITSMVSLQS